jgi:hypothetical protein
MATQYSTKSRFPAVFTITAPLLAASVDQHVYVATRPGRVLEVREVHSVVGGSGATVNLRKCTSGTAPASGTSMLSAAVNVESPTVNVPRTATLSTTLINREFAAGESLALDFSGTLTGLVGHVTIVLETY